VKSACKDDQYSEEFDVRQLVQTAIGKLKKVGEQKFAPAVLEIERAFSA
jgi:hypothetical protein